MCRPGAIAGSVRPLIPAPVTARILQDNRMKIYAVYESVRTGREVILG